MTESKLKPSLTPHWFTAAPLCLCKHINDIRMSRRTDKSPMKDTHVADLLACLCHYVEKKCSFYCLLLI